MRTIAYNDHLFQLTRFPRIFPVNCYLVREQDGFTLIDAALQGSAPAIIAATQKLGAPIAHIILTHAHGDHVGSLDALHAALPNAEVLVHERSAPLLAGDKTLLPEERKGELKGYWIPCATKPDRTFVHGERIGSLEVVASPGHTPDHVAFLDTRDRTLIAGDAFQTRAGIAVSGTLRPLFPFPALATWHKPTALASACTLRTLNPTCLAVGHGELLPNPQEAMERAIAVAAQKLGAQVAHVA